MMAVNAGCLSAVLPAPPVRRRPRRSKLSLAGCGFPALRCDSNWDKIRRIAGCRGANCCKLVTTHALSALPRPRRARRDRSTRRGFALDSRRSRDRKQVNRCGRCPPPRNGAAQLANRAASHRQSAPAESWSRLWRPVLRAPRLRHRRWPRSRISFGRRVMRPPAVSERHRGPRLYQAPQPSPR